MSRPSFSSSLPRCGLPRAQKSGAVLLQKELQGNRSCMLRIGERLMRAGSEGNLLQRPGLNLDHNGPLQHEHKAAKVSLADLYANPELLLQRKYHHSSSSSSSSSSSKQVTAFRSAPNSPSTLPRRQATTRGQQRDAEDRCTSRGQQRDAEDRCTSRGQQRDAEDRCTSRGQQRDAEDRCTSRGQQSQTSDMFLDRLRLVSTRSGPEELREVKRGSRLPPCGFLTEADSAESMTDDDRFNVGFTRGSRGRSSLPLNHSTPIRERALGVVYLQLGEETKQVQVCSDLSNMDALRALFVRAFPQQLSVRLLQSPHASICIRDSSHSSYRQLEDVRSISPQCCLKVYVRDPGPRPSTSTEPRISKELLYGGHSSALQNLQGSMSPPMVRSMPSSPSKGQGSSTLPRQRPQGAGRKLSTNSSAILERRDVMPDEEACPSLALVLHPDALPRTLDSVTSVPPSVPSVPASVPSVRVSSQCSAPPSLCVERQERQERQEQGPGAGGLLPQFHASVKPLHSLHSHTDALQTNSLNRPKIRQKFGDFPLLGPQSPPGSPQRRSTRGGHIIGGVGLVPPLPQDALDSAVNGVPLEAYRGRSHGSTSSNSSVFVDSPLAQTDDVFRSLGPSGSQSERISAMEEQIASLAGLVHRALSVGAEIPEIHDFTSENGPHSLLFHKPVTSHASSRAAAQSSLSNDALKHRLTLAKHSVSDLRLQLEQLRHQQISQQAAVHSMLRAMGQELLGFMRQKLIQSHEAFLGPRAEVERGRRDYVSSQDRILLQLSELEEFVDGLQRSVRSGPGSVSLRDVELAAVNLRKVGQAMALLKGEFPQLQSRMCSVLRLEVEVMRFLKEEPLKMDSMLSRIRNLTEELSTLHRSVSESFVQSKDDSEQTQVHGSPRPLPRSSFRAPQTCSDSGALQTGPASPKVTRSSTTSTEQNTITQETTRQTPDGSPDSTQTKADQTRTDQDQPESTQSDRSLQDPLASREGPTLDPPQTSDQEASPAESTQAEDTKHKDDSNVFKRPERPSTQNKSIKVNTSSPPAQRSEVGASAANVKSVEVKEEAAAPQVEREKVQMTKPPRQPPEVKPKPQKSAALKVNSSSNHCPVSATTTATEREERKDTEVTVDVSLPTTAERSSSTSGNNNNRPKEMTTPNTDAPRSNLQTQTKHISAARTPENSQNGANSAQKQNENNHMEINKAANPQISNTSLPVLQKYTASIVSLEEICQKCSKEDSATSRQTFNHLIQDTTSKNSEDGSSSPTKTSALENGNCNGTDMAFDNEAFEDFCTDFSQEPFVVFWNEPVDIEAAFNRLSTIFECEEELAKSRESVLNEDEGEAKISAPPVQFTFQGEVTDDTQVKKSDGKKKFKLKFPKNKLAQISRAIRTGKSKKHEETEVNKRANGSKSMQISSPRPKKQVKELCKNALDSIDSLEASIKQLEISVDSFAVATSPPTTPNPGLESAERSRRPTAGIQKDSQPPQRKRAKQTPLFRPRSSSEPQDSPTDLTLSPKISRRKRPSSHTQ